MKKIAYLLVIAWTFVACQKDDPTPEVDQEEIGGAELLFTEVDREISDGQYHYTDIANPDKESIRFTGTQMVPPVGEHIHLSVGKTYRFQLKAKDFYGRETQHTFVDKAENHFAFILGIPQGAAEIVYMDIATNGSTEAVGVSGYITVIAETSTFEMRYIMRHLNNSVKANIDPATDWSDTNFSRFTGANDLDLKFATHFAEGDHGH